MTKAIRVLFASLLFGTALLAGAQDLRVQVPFDFNVSGKALPAGTYTVSRIFGRYPGVLVLRGAQDQKPILLSVGFDSERSGAALSFHRYGEDYYLSSITTESGKFKVASTPTERMAAAKRPAEEVSVGSSQ